MSGAPAVKLEGAFFTVNPGLVLFGNLKKTMQAVADEGAAQVRSRYLVGALDRAPVRAFGDRTADHVIGRTVARPSKGGRQWVSAAVVQVYNEGTTAAESRSLMAAGSLVEGRTHAIADLTRTITNAGPLTRMNLTAGME